MPVPGKEFVMWIIEKIWNFLREQAGVRNRRDLCFLILKVAVVYFVLIESAADLFYLMTRSPGMFLLYLGERIAIIVVFSIIYKKAGHLRRKGVSDRFVAYSVILLVVIFWVNGSLLGIYYFDGPYWGRVEDADTREPVAGACVVGKWNFICPAPTHSLSVDFIADVRETVTDERGWFLLPPARTLWLWPLSLIRLEDIYVFRSGYDAHPPLMESAWTDEESRKWRDKLRPEILEYYQHTVPDSEKYLWKSILEDGSGRRYYRSFFSIDGRECRVYRPTVIRLNKAESVKEQCKAARVSPGYNLDYEKYKVRKMTDAVDRERERLGYKACY